MTVVIDGTSGINTPGVVNTAAETIATTLAVTGVTTFAAGTAALPAITTTGDTNTGIFFPAADTIAFAEGGAEAMRIDSSGQLGIGTSLPTSKVHISQSAASTSLTIDGIENPIFATRYAANADGAVLFLAKSRNATVGSHTIVQNGDQIAVVQARASNGTSFVDAASIVFAIDGTPGAGNDMPGRIVFGTSSDGSATVTERARIDSSGNLLAGGATAAFDAGDSSNSSGQGVNISQSAYRPLQAYAANGTVAAFKRNGNNGAVIVFARGSVGEVGSISVNTTATAYNTSSDYRLKNTIAPMTGALAKVALLKPCTYKWNLDGSDGQGFIAHELAEVVEGCVSGEKDAVDADGKPQYQGIDTSFLVATLTAAIQEQQALITALTTRITALESAP